METYYPAITGVFPQFELTAIDSFRYIVIVAAIRNLVTQEMFDALQTCLWLSLFAAVFKNPQARKLIDVVLSYKQKTKSEVPSFARHGTDIIHDNVTDVFGSSQWKKQCFRGSSFKLQCCGTSDEFSEDCFTNNEVFSQDPIILASRNVWTNNDLQQPFTLATGQAPTARHFVCDEKHSVGQPGFDITENNIE